MGAQGQDRWWRQQVLGQTVGSWLGQFVMGIALTVLGLALGPMMIGAHPLELLRLLSDWLLTPAGSVWLIAYINALSLLALRSALKRAPGPSAAVKTSTGRLLGWILRSDPLTVIDGCELRAPRWMGANWTPENPGTDERRKNIYADFPKASDDVVREVLERTAFQTFTGEYDGHWALKKIASSLRFRADPGGSSVVLIHNAPNCGESRAKLWRLDDTRRKVWPKYQFFIRR